ncbi:hypothetical protein HY086_00610 [Candidatus Gottesmanbacteria bacterium]|nr:hypothetical protein [Candidatus Gottesmanbacteria bacterium]
MTTAYQKFVTRWEEVMELPPQRLGPLTPLYKRLVKHLKVMPLPLLVLGSLFIVLGLYVLIGSTITFLVSLLQRGF